MTETKLDVPDMSCAHRKAAVEGSLNALDSVECSSADPEKGVVEVAYDEGRLKTEDLNEAVKSADYTVAF